MRPLLLLATAALVTGCWSTTPAETAPPATTQKAKAPKRGAKAKTKAGHAKGKAKAKSKASKPPTPPPEYGVEGPVAGTLKLTVEEVEEGKKKTKAEIDLTWEAREGVEAGTASILLGNAPGTCEAAEPTPFTEAETEITPLWSAKCTHEKATALIVLYQAGNLLLIKRAVLGAEDKPGPWKPVKKVRLAKGAQLTN